MKVGFAIHQKRMRRADEERVIFTFEVWEDDGGRGGESKSPAVVHGGSGRNERRQGECRACGRWVSKSTYARHQRMCEGEQGVEAGEE